MKNRRPRDPAKEKTKGFRFGLRTLENLRVLTDELKLSRNDTEAVEMALEHVVTEERLRKQMKDLINAQYVKKEIDAPAGN